MRCRRGYSRLDVLQEDRNTLLACGRAAERSGEASSGTILFCSMNVESLRRQSLPGYVDVEAPC